MFGERAYGKAAFWVAASWVALLAESTASRAQIIIPPRPAGGVYVDPSGVVRSRIVQTAKARRASRAEAAASKAVEVPLVQLFQDARRELESTRSLSSRIRHLDGLVEIHSIRVDPAGKEIFLVGVQDEIGPSTDRAPLGRETNLSAMYIDDLVVALRTVGPGRAMQPFGCSIDMDPNGLGRAQSAANDLIRKQNYDAREIVRAMERAIGMQAVRVFGAAPNTPFAAACVEADVRLKRLALGLDPSPVKRVKSHLSMSREHGAAYTRWWFVPDYEPIGVSEDGLEFELSGRRLKLLASDSPTELSKPTASAQRFVELFNANMDELCNEIPEFSRLRHLADMAVAAALIASDRLDERVGWDLQWITNDFPVPEATVPEEAEPLVNMVRKGSVINVAAGGVQIDVGRIVRGNRQSSSTPMK